MAEKNGGNIRKEQAEATKRRLIDSARKAFSEKGYKGTSVRFLSGNLGISESLLYHYFPQGKKELFRQVVDEELTEVLSSLSRLENDEQMYSLPIEDALDKLFFEFSGAVIEHIDIIKIIVRESIVQEFMSGNDICRILNSFDKWLENMMQKRIESGEIRNIDCKTTALTIKAILINCVLVSILDIDIGQELSERRKNLINYYVSILK